MADISVTASSVAPTSTTTTATGTAGASITAGQSVYVDSSTNTIKLADCDASAAAAGSAGFGIALHAAASGQPIVYAVGGDVTFNSALTAAKIYVVSATAGGIAPSADITTNWRTSILGVATSATNLSIRLYASGVASA